MSYLMYRLDSPVSSRANCKLAYEWPCNVSTAGYPDLCVNYGRGCIVHVEVSSRELMVIKDFNEQLKSALTHMVEKKANWTLLVTGWDFKRANEEKYKYSNFLAGSEHNAERRNIIIMSIQENGRPEFGVEF